MMKLACRQRTIPGNCEFFQLGILLIIFFSKTGKGKDSHQEHSGSSLSVKNPYLSYNNPPWVNWTSSRRTELNHWDQIQAPNVVPLTLQEFNIRKSKVKKSAQQIIREWQGSSDQEHSNIEDETRSRPTKHKNGKIGKRKSSSGKDSEDDGYRGSGNKKVIRNDSRNDKKKDKKEREPKGLFPEGIEFYPRAFMNFEIFEVEVFIKPQFKELNPKVWTDMG